MEEEPERNENVNTDVVAREPAKKSILRNVLIVFLAIIFGILHYNYAHKLFENDRNFSMLSDLEREMSFHSEMGFYYSYYKTLVESKTFVTGLNQLLVDKLVEFPDTVNALRRFNLAPEVIIAALYRVSEPWLNESSPKDCDVVDRGEILKPVETCNGLAVPMVFYLNFIWILAGMTLSVVFMFAVTLSGSILGGLLAVCQYMSNHSEITRVHWSPNERENMALPFLLLHSWILTVQLRHNRPRQALKLQIAICLLNCICLQFWQFTQYIFVAQIAIFFMMEQFHIIEHKDLCVFLHSHFCTLHLSMFLFEGSDILKSSLYVSYFTMVCAYAILFSSLRVKIEDRTSLYIEGLLILMRFFIVLLGAIYMKLLISDYLNVNDDGHVWQIFLSKFIKQNSFLVKLYTCTDVFSYLPLATLKSMSNTLLIPLSVVACFLALISWLPKRNIDMIDADTEVNDSKDNPETRPETNVIASNDWLIVFLKSLNVESTVWYNLNLLVVYGMMAVLVMRLKLLFGTQLCIVCSLVMGKKYFRWLSISKYPWAMPVAIFAYMAHALTVNVTKEMSYIGEFGDTFREEMLEWIIHKTPSGAAFAGALPVLANVMLSTRRPIVAHPHFENYYARQRAYSVLKTFGRFSTTELYADLTRYQVSYLIVDNPHCYGASNLGCSFEAMWKVEFPSHGHYPRICHQLLTEKVNHLYPVFSNLMFTVFRVHDYSVEYMPRSFDT